MPLVVDVLVGEAVDKGDMMRLCFIHILIIAALLFDLTKVQGETILEFYNMALQSDTKLELAESSLDGAVARLEKSKSWLKPQINLSANHKENRGTYEYPSSSFSLTLTQSLFDYDRWVDVDEARAYVSQEEARFESARQDLIMRVATVYFDLLAAEESVELAKTEKQAIGQQLNHSKQRLEAGLSTTADVHEAQAAYDLAVAQEISAQSTLDIAHEAVYEIAGQTLDNTGRLKANIPLTIPKPREIDSWVELALQNNFDIIAQQAAIDASNEALSGAKAEHLPTLSFVTGYSYLNTTGARYGEESNTRYLGVEFALPIYSGGLTTAKIKEATHQLTQVKTTLEQIRRTTIRQSRSAYLAVTVGIAQVKARQQSTISAEASSEAIEEAFKAGKRTIVDVLDAQQDLYRAQNELIHTRYDYLLAVLALKETVGNLQESDLASITALFDNT